MRLNAPGAAVDQATGALADHLLQSIESQIAPEGVGDPPADDPAGEDIDHEAM